MRISDWSSDVCSSDLTSAVRGGPSRLLQLRSRTMNELIQIGPTSPLRQRLMDDMTLRGLSTETQRNYLRDVGRLANWLRRSPTPASTEDIRQLKVEPQPAGGQATPQKKIVSAARIFFT